MATVKRHMLRLLRSMNGKKINHLMRKSFSLSAFSSAVRNCGQRRATWWNVYIRHSTQENWSLGPVAASLPELLSAGVNSSA